MNKKLLIENFFIFGLGQILYKIIPLIALPIIVRILPDSSYFLGISDLSNTVISLVSILGLMGMYDGIFRLFFDYNDKELTKQKSVCSTALFIVIVLSIVTGTLFFAFRNVVSYGVFKEYLPSVMIVCTIGIMLSPISTVIAVPTRILNERKVYIAGSLMAAVVGYVASIALVYMGQYIIALPLGILIGQVTSTLYYWVRNKKWFSVKELDKGFIKPLLNIGVPLMPTFLIFWVYSSVDRLMILNSLGMAYNGRYAVAGKFAQISQLITTAFASGWSYFTFSTMKEEDHAKVFSKIITYILVCGTISFVVCRLFGDFFIRILFTEEYSGLGATFSYLFIIPIINMAFQMMGSQFLIIKKTGYTSLLAGCGVILDVLLNLVLIDRNGILGASIATLCSYFSIYFIALMVLNKKEMYKEDYRNAVCYLILGTFIITDIFCNNVILTIGIGVVGTVTLLIVYRKDLLEMIMSIFLTAKNGLKNRA